MAPFHSHNGFTPFTNATLRQAPSNLAHVFNPRSELVPRIASWDFSNEVQFKPCIDTLALIISCKVLKITISPVSHGPKNGRPDYLIARYTTSRYHRLLVALTDSVA